MTPEIFDAKLAELRDIERRMKQYDHKTPIKKVASDQRKAQALYNELEEAVVELKAPGDMSLDNTKIHYNV